ncbi:hypothetical protein IAT40_006305 [Kwoniella sp. CBS 6097]
MVVKREFTTTSNEDIAEALGFNMDIKPSSNLNTPSPSPSPKKKQKASPKKKGTSSPSKDDKPRQTKNAWTAEEDAIFIELMLKTLHKSLYFEIKADGRLARESPAVKAHLIAMMNKLKRGQGQNQ